MSKNQWNKIYKKDGKKYKYYDIIDIPHPDLEKVMKVFKKAKVKKVLDLGCGAGRNTWPMAKNGFEVYGLDLAKDGINLLKKYLNSKNLTANLKVGDIFSPLPYNDNYFDAIVSVQVLQHGKEKDIKKSLKEVVRVLKPNGLIFITLCGRVSKGQVRFCLVKTAKKIAPNTYVPTQGGEADLIHFIYNKELIKKHYKDFKLIKMWRDDKDYFCFIAKNKK